MLSSSMPYVELTAAWLSFQIVVIDLYAEQLVWLEGDSSIVINWRTTFSLSKHQHTSSSRICWHGKQLVCYVTYRTPAGRPTKLQIIWQIMLCKEILCGRRVMSWIHHLLLFFGLMGILFLLLVIHNKDVIV